MVPVCCAVCQPGRAQNPWHLSGNKFGQLLWRQQRNVSFRGIAYHCLAVYLLQFMAYKNFNLVYFILTLCFSSVPTLKQQVCTSLCPLFMFTGFCPLRAFIIPPFHPCWSLFCFAVFQEQTFYFDRSKN